MEERRKQDLTAEADGIIEGRNAVIEALRAGETIDKIYLQKGETDKTLGHIASKARAAGVVVVEADRRKLDAMSRTHAHQGVIALAAVREYVSVESIQFNPINESIHDIANSQYSVNILLQTATSLSYFYQPYILKSIE